MADPAHNTAFSDSYAGIIRIRFQGLGIHVYLVSAGPYPAPLFTCETNLALQEGFVNAYLSISALSMMN